MSPELIAAAVAMCILAEDSSDTAINKRENAVGCLQIRPIYVRDLNERTGSHWRHEDAKNSANAIRMVSQYLTLYGNEYERKTGKAATVEILCRIHNGGPQGWKKASTLAYWQKAQRMKRIAQEGRDRGRTQKSV